MLRCNAMYAFPISDTSLFAINDTAKKTWRSHWVDFEPLRVDRLETPRAPGPVLAAALNPHLCGLVSRRRGPRHFWNVVKRHIFIPSLRIDEKT
jgi:hypothetical protein